MFLPLLLLCACSEGKVVESHPDADRLYADTRRLVAVYSDSLEAAADSAEVEALFTRFQQRLDSLNFSVPPDTDLQLTEGRNDTLFVDIMGLRDLYRRRLTAPSDTLSAEAPEEETAGPTDIKD